MHKTFVVILEVICDFLKNPIIIMGRVIMIVTVIYFVINKPYINPPILHRKIFTRCL